MTPSSDATAGLPSLPYEIRTDSARGLLHIVLRGTWDMPVFDQFSAAYIAAVKAFAGKDGVTHQLVDSSDFAVQPAEIAERFPALIQAAHAPACPRSASVVPAMLNRVQARPCGEILNARYFRTLDDAEAWLFGNEA